MSEDKLCSYEVPQKFTEWLLAMGCPAEKVPTVDKVTLMCRGQYYMVWRSLMEHVYPKNVIRDKRLQVFCNDVSICNKKSAFSQNLNVIVPEQISLYQQQKDLKEKVYDAENRLKQSQETLNQLMDKITTKVSQRNVSRQRVQDLQRRVWLLQQVSEELQCRKDNLEETWTIANSLCCIRNENEIQNKVDKCVAVLRRQGSQTASAASSISMLSNANPVASSSAVSIQSECADTEEQVSSLVRCGAAAWAQLRERRAVLAAALAAANAAQPASRVPDARATPQSVLAHTASLHCTLALEAMKNRVHIKHTRSRLASSVTDLNAYLSGEACELLVLRCEKARSEARVNTLRGLLQELTSRSGIFKTNGEDITDKQTTIRQIATIDKAIETKRDELKRLLAILSITERKIHNVKECLVTVFNNFQKDSPINDTYRGKGIQVDFPKESISTLRQFYEERRERRRNKPDLSMEFDVSDYSFSDAVDGNPRFIDELKIYLKKFNLEKNKKLVLDSGEKIWIFETVQSLINRLHSLWLSDDVSCSLIYPSVGLRSLCHLVNDVKTKELLEGVVKELNNAEVKNNVAIDINSRIEQEAELIDKIKKRIGGNLTTLQQSEKTLELGQENLKFWADNKLKKYISNNRTVDGKTYKDYEAFYLECLSLNV